MNKREFLTDAILFIPAAGVLQALVAEAAANAVGPAAPDGYDATRHWYGMGIDVGKCIGCNRCVEACKAENNVPDEPFYFRTWIERYRIHSDGETTVECISTRAGPPEQVEPEDPTVVRTFFVPKLCNQCANPPCVQVCPVGATFTARAT
ncbi:MAG: tetrathionate reductase beta subunit [Proteobacteria bacterium]|nr:tetrathionate reductase beta subunit [Pseudomonadota bacterium]